MTPHAILVIDDEISVRESLKIVFSKEHAVFEADSMEPALAIIEKDRPAVVLLDMRMPKNSGIEVLQRIKAIGADCEVIMLTALNTRQLAEKALDLGAFDVIGKPFDVVELRAKVSRALAKFLRGNGSSSPPA